MPRRTRLLWLHPLDVRCVWSAPVATAEPPEELLPRLPDSSVVEYVTPLTLHIDQNGVATTGFFQRYSVDGGWQPTVYQTDTGILVTDVAGVVTPDPTTPPPPPPFQWTVNADWTTAKHEPVPVPERPSVVSSGQPIDPPPAAEARTKPPAPADPLPRPVEPDRSALPEIDDDRRSPTTDTTDAVRPASAAVREFVTASYYHPVDTDPAADPEPDPGPLPPPAAHPGTQSEYEAGEPLPGPAATDEQPLERDWQLPVRWGVLLSAGGLTAYTLRPSRQRPKSGDTIPPENVP